MTPSEGNNEGEIMIAVSNNPKVEERTVTLTFSVGIEKNFRTLKLLQKPYGPSLFVLQNDSEPINNKGDDITFTIDSNNDSWEYSIENNPNWITEKEITDTSLVLTAIENSGDDIIAPIVFNLILNIW